MGWAMLPDSVRLFARYGGENEAERQAGIVVGLVLDAPQLIVRRLDRITLIERLDDLQRFPELSPCLIEAEMSFRDALNLNANIWIVRHEDAVDRQRP
jgi:hypothetical protein